MSVEDITLQRRLAASQLAQGADFSPVQHWTQGAARAATGLLGGLGMRRADDMAEDRATGQQETIAALLAKYDPASGAPDPVAAGLADPELRPFAMQVLESRTPKAVEPVIQRANNGDIIGLNPMTGEVMFTQADPNPKPVIDWQRAVDPLTGEVTLTPFGPNGPMTGAPQAPQVLGPELPEGWTIEEGGPASAPGNFRP